MAAAAAAAAEAVAMVVAAMSVPVSSLTRPPDAIVVAAYALTVLVARSRMVANVHWLAMVVESPNSTLARHSHWSICVVLAATELADLVFVVGSLALSNRRHHYSNVHFACSTLFDRRPAELMTACHLVHCWRSLHSDNNSGSLVD